jgi:hypothetical protein
MGIERKDVVATSADLYRVSLEERLSRLAGKTWAELTPEEKDVILESYAVRSRYVRAPE